ncbi:MAG: OmpP1/FadL family transporter [Myxococcota bacterium]
MVWSRAFRGSGVLLAGILLAPLTAHAAGFELTPAGGRANGRAGAVRAGGDSPMAMFYNPALLADLPGHHAMVATHLHFGERCMTRVEVEEMGGDRNPGEAYPEVCSSGVGIIPELATSFELADGLALGLGLYAPAAAMRTQRYGDPETAMLESGELSPLRYLLIESDLFQAFPSIGFAYEPHPAIRIGATFGWGITKIGFANAAYSELDCLGEDCEEPPEGPFLRADARNAASAQDRFVPRLLLGVHVRPQPEVPFELGLTYQWTDDVQVNSATLDIETFNLRDAAGNPLELPNPEGVVPGVGIHVPQVSQLGFGMRWFQPLDSPVDTIGDRMSTEMFDIEANVLLTFGKRVDDFFVDLPDDAVLEAIGDIEVDLPDDVTLPHRWKTQVSLYLGGDYNVVPGMLALRGGLSFDSNGVQRGYEQLDFTPFRRVGLHLGTTLRIARRIDVSVAYAHIFQPDRSISVDDAQLRRAIGGDVEPDDAIVTNAGTITSRYHVLVLEAGAHF